MVKIPLTQGKFALVDADMEHLKNWRWYYAKHPTGGYARRCTDSRVMLMHHAIIGFPLNGLFVDHINGDGIDNRRENLRLVTPRGNTHNRKCHRQGKRMVGTSFNKSSGRWVAFIASGKKQTHLGYFDTQELAGEAYQSALDRVRGK